MRIINLNEEYLIRSNSSESVEKNSNVQKIHYLENEEEVLKKLTKDLINFGLSNREARIYLHLARFGPKKANKVSEDLNTHRTDTYHTLTSLQNKGIVYATLERPISFIALPLEKAIEKIIKIEKEKISFAEKRSKHVFEIWASLPNNIENDIPVKQFQIFEGNEQAYGKLREMQRNVKNDINIMMSRTNLSRLDCEGILDIFLKSVVEKGISIKVITECVNDKILIESIEKNLVRNIPPYIRPIPNFIIMDQSDLLFFTSKEDETWRKTSVIWTNYDVLTKPLHLMFNKVWKNSS